MPNPPSIKEIVEFGLEAIPEGRKVEVPLRDLMHIHQVLSEWNRFFHQPLHYQNIEAVAAFLGSRDSGGGHEVLSEALYEKLGLMLPEDILEKLEASAFDHPENPAYYKSGA